MGFIMLGTLKQIALTAGGISLLSGCSMFQRQHMNVQVKPTMSARQDDGVGAAGLAYSAQSLLSQVEQEFRKAIASAPRRAHQDNSRDTLYLRLDRTHNASVEYEPLRSPRFASVRTLNNPASARDDVQLVSVAPNVWELRRHQTTQPAMDISAWLAAPAPARGAKQAAVSTGAGRMAIVVANGNRLPGHAASVDEYLQAPGYVHPRLTNQLPYHQVQTEVRYVAESATASGKLASILKAPVRLVVVARTEQKFQLRIVPAKDFGASANATGLPKPAVKYLASSQQAARISAMKYLPGHIQHLIAVRSNPSEFL